MQPLNTPVRSLAVVSNERLWTYNVDFGVLELERMTLSVMQAIINLTAVSISNTKQKPSLYLLLGRMHCNFKCVFYTHRNALKRKVWWHDLKSGDSVYKRRKFGKFNSEQYKVANCLVFPSIHQIFLT